MRWLLHCFVLLLPLAAAAQDGGDLDGVIDPPDLFEEALPRIQSLYLHPEAVDIDRMLRAGLQDLEDVGPEVLVREVATDPQALLLSVGDQEARVRLDDVTDLDGLQRRLEEALAFVLQHAPAWRDEPLDGDDLRIEALQGMLATIDRHSRLIVGGGLDEFNTRFKGTLVGIGARVGRRQGELRVIEPFLDAPASRGGLLANDAITHIDGQPTAGLSVDDAVDRIRGPVGVPVVLTVMRPGEEHRRIFVLKREKVLVPSVESELLAGDVGLLRVDHFSQKTSQEFSRHLDQLGTNGTLRGVIIDLRGNTGGSMRHAARIVNQFVAEGVLVRTEGRNRRPVVKLTPRIDAQEKFLRYEGPVVVLVNRRTASGSEIVAGGIKWLERGLILGSQTFGKGTVQKVYSLRKGAEPASLKLTVARYLLPTDAFINSIGVTPDVLTGQVWLDPDEPTIPDVLREPDRNTGAVTGPGALDSRHNPGGGDRAPNTGGINAAPLARIWYPRILDGWGDQDRSLPTPDPRPAGWANHAGDAGDDRFNDFDLRLAHEVLLESAATDRRDELISHAREVVENWQPVQLERMVQAAEAGGLSWARTSSQWMDRTPGREDEVQRKLTAPPPALRATLELPSPLPAGETVTAKVTVHNPGTEPVHHLRARLESSTDILDGASFLLGDVPPGGSRSASVPLAVGAGAVTRSDPWRLYLIDDAGPLGGPTEGLVHVKGGAPAELELQVEAKPEPQADGSVLITATIDVRNTGADAGEVQAWFGAPKDDDVERLERWASLESLDHGDSGQLTLSLRVRDPSRRASLSMRLRARDKRSNQSTTVSVELPLSGDALQTGWLRPPSIELTWPGGAVGAPVFTPDDATELAGEASARAGLSSVEVFRDNDKIFSRSFPIGRAQPKSLPLAAPLDLEVGPSRVRVRVRTADGVEASRTWWVLGHKPG